MRHARYCSVFALTLVLAACGHGNAPSDAADAGDQAQAQAEASQPVQAPPAANPPATAEADAVRPLQVSDLDAYAKGMQKEIELRQAASDKAAKAKADKDQQAEVNALADITSVEVTNAGAQAAGVDAARYNVIKNGVDRVLSAVEMNAAMAKMDGAAQMQKMHADPYAGLNADVASALKAREAELGKLRASNMAILVNAQNL